RGSRPHRALHSFPTRRSSDLSRLRTEFPALLQEYATRGLEYGQRVRVLPTGHVYRYGGLWPDSTDFFELRVLDASDRARRTFPVDRKSTRLNSSHVSISYAVF